MQTDATVVEMLFVFSAPPSSRQEAGIFLLCNAAFQNGAGKYYSGSRYQVAGVWW